MTNWAQYRPDKAKFVPSYIDPFICTHIIYAFASINSTSFVIRPFEWNDESNDGLVGLWHSFKLIILLYSKNRNFKF